MEKYCNADFERIYSGKSEVDNEQDYSLPEYLPGILKILKTDARIKTEGKSLQGDTLYINGRVIYNVLYSADFDGRLINATFSDEFSYGFDLSKYSFDGIDESMFFIDAHINSASSRMQNQRKISSKSRFTLSFDVVESQHMIRDCENPSDIPDCNIEYLERDMQTLRLLFSDDNRKSISEEIILDESMPEIDEIVTYDVGLCVMSTKLSDNTSEADGYIKFSCLYKALDEETSYITMKREIPIKLSCDVFDTEGDIYAMTVADIMSHSCEVTSDNYGENRIISVGANINYGLFCFTNKSVVIPTDAYSTNCEIQADVRREVISVFCGVYDDSLNVNERLRCDLRGINSVISSELLLGISNPEKYDDKLSVGARGALSVIGMKENGEIDSVQIPINLHIESEKLSQFLTSDIQKYKFINSSCLCAHTCEISGGELLLNADIHASYSAILEENCDVVCSVKVNEKCEKSSFSKFSIYYPDSGESVWSVAKKHGVSCRNLKKLNNITGETFEGKKSVVLK